MKNYVITIARGFGSGGKEIGVNLGKKLGIPCYERQILDMASDFSGISKSLFVEQDEKLKKNKILRKLAGYPHTMDVASPSSSAFVSDSNLFNIQAEIMQNLAQTESCIIIGKCADYVLRECDNVVSVYIEAPRATCVASLRNKLGISEESAHKLITRTDKYRSDYYSYYSRGGIWTNPINYDFTLNSFRMGREKCVELIADYVQMKFGDA